MKTKIINAGYGIRSCNTEDIPEFVTKLGCAKDAIFFYCKERDWIVLNEDHVKYEIYKLLIETYLSFDDIQRKELMRLSLSEDSKIFYVALRNLNWIIRVRRKLYKSMIGKECAKHETD